MILHLKGKNQIIRESEDNPIFWMHKYEITLILFYVFFFFGYSRENFKIMMINEFEMTDISLISCFLGLEEKQHCEGRGVRKRSSWKLMIKLILYSVH